MTASPPWTPSEAPPPPVYPMTDEDVLSEPVPVERFGPPQEAARPGLIDRLRDRLATRRALTRASSAYDDSVQIVSGSGAPLRPGRARVEVERRRQEALRAEPGAIPTASVQGIPADTPDLYDVDADDDLGLGPLPPRTRPIGAMPLPAPHHTLGSALGEIPLPPPHFPAPPAVPPRPPMPDPLGDALAGFDRSGTSDPQRIAAERRPWRPRDIPADMAPAAPAHREADTPPAPPRQAPRHTVPAPAQLREGRRLLALFGAGTLVLLTVGIVSGRTTSPLPTSTTTPQAHAPASARPHPSQPAAQASAAPTQLSLGPTVPTQPAPAAAAGALTGVKVLGDGGTGYQIKDFRYGVHPNDFRIVLDLVASGASSGTPKVTLGFSDSTTLLVGLDGVVAAGSTGQLPSSDPVQSVSLLSQSPIAGATTYQLKLAHAVTFSAYYVTTSQPLRLVIDIAG